MTPATKEELDQFADRDDHEQSIRSPLKLFEFPTDLYQLSFEAIDLSTDFVRGRPASHVAQLTHLLLLRSAMPNAVRHQIALVNTATNRSDRGSATK